jgi:hypothetical protein
MKEVTFLAISFLAFASNECIGGKFLSDEELKIDRKLAIDGDARSAMALADHYLYFENDMQESNFWIRLAAEMNDCRAINELFDRFKHGVYLINKERLPFWEEKKKLFCGR